MNSIKAAAILALTTAVAAATILCYELYENVILLRAEIDALNHIEGKGPSIDHNLLLEYGLPGAIALVFLIVALVLWGASRSTMIRRID